MSNQEEPSVDTNEDVDQKSLCEWMWNEKDSGKGVVVHKDKRYVTFHPSKSVHCAAVRGVKPLAPNMEHYFEVEMKGPFCGQARQVGIGTKSTTLQSNIYDYYPLLGKDMFSWGVNYTGQKCHAGDMARHIPFDFDKHSTIRIGVHFDSYYGHLSFEFNGKSPGLAFDRVITNVDYYPMLCASAQGTEMKLTQCFSSVMSLKALCRGVIRNQISSDRDYDKLTLPNHLKSYLQYKTPKTHKSHSNKKGGALRNSHVKAARESSI